MAKVVNQPVTDIYNRDIMTWEIVETYISKGTTKHLERSKKEFEEKEIKNGKIFVSGLWWVDSQ